MDVDDTLSGAFERQRPHLRAVAFRMLGSWAEAEDAIQETWLRLARSDSGKVHNLGGWLTTAIGRICVDMLRSRASRRENPLDGVDGEADRGTEHAPDPEVEVLLADSVGLALLVVLDTLSPDERLAFVLHDIFAVPFKEISPILERTEDATKMLASRARHRIRSADSTPRPEDPIRQRAVARAFLSAARAGRFEDLIGLLHPEVELRADGAAIEYGGVGELHGAAAVATQFNGRAQAVRPAIIDGVPGGAGMRGGHPLVVFVFSVIAERIAAIDVIADPDRLEQLDVQVLEPEPSQ